MLRLSQIRSSLARQWQRASSSNRTTGYAALPVNADDLSVMVFGAGTDVGKTSVIAGLSSASMKAGRKVCYLKPVQTGDLDEFFIQFYTNPRGINDIFVRTLHHWKAKAAPQFAAKLDRVVASETITDQELLSSIQREIKAFSESAALDDISPGTPQKKPFIVVETSGGALSPGTKEKITQSIGGFYVMVYLLIYFDDNYRTERQFTGRSIPFIAYAHRTCRGRSSGWYLDHSYGLRITANSRLYSTRPSYDRSG